MFARLSIYENVDLDLADQVKQWVEASGTDPFGELPGYRGGTLRRDLLAGVTVAALALPSAMAYTELARLSRCPGCTPCCSRPSPTPCSARPGG